MSAADWDMIGVAVGLVVIAIFAPRLFVRKQHEQHEPEFSPWSFPDVRVRLNIVEHEGEIGHLTDADRAAGWVDIRCQGCGTIGGAGLGVHGGGIILSCRSCPNFEEEVAKLRVVDLETGEEATATYVSDGPGKLISFHPALPDCRPPDMHSFANTSVRCQCGAETWPEEGSLAPQEWVAPNETATGPPSRDISAGSRRGDFTG